MKAFHHRIRRICACLVGVVFVLAGLFKLLDPVGAGLVVGEYYKFLHLSFLLPTAKGVAVGLALFEALLGAALISGIWRKPVAILTCAMVVLFTLLTLVLAIVNPPMDCGCFGEAIHLSNPATFLKNLGLLALSCIAFLPFKDFGGNRNRKYVSFGLVAAGFVLFTIRSLSGIPERDFTVFSPGAELFAATDNPVDPEEGYEATFIYEKNGQKGAFTLDRLPDSTWTYVRTETVRKKGLENEATPVLSFTDSAGVYQDELAARGNVLAASVYAPGKLKGDSWTKIADLLDGASAAGFTPLLLVAAGREGIAGLPAIVPEVRSRLSARTYFADYKTLVTLNRSNGGATWFSDGQLITKYPLGRLPSREKLLQMTGDDATEVMLHDSTRSRIRFDTFLLYTFGVLWLL